MRYKALNIPQNGLDTNKHTRVHPGFQNTGLAIARPVLKISNDLIVFLTFSLENSRPGPNSPYIHIRWGKSSPVGISRLFHDQLSFPVFQPATHP